MSDQTPTPSNPALREKWDRDGVLYHVWRAHSLYNAVECLEHMSSDESDLPPEQQAKRTMVLAMCKKFVEDEAKKELRLAYDELSGYLFPAPGMNQ